jgi:uncharacterized protein
MAGYAKPLPVPDSGSQEYWNGTHEHKLRAQRCASCNRLRWPPQGFCPYCCSWDFTWDALRQTGHVESYVVVHQAPPAFANEAPYTVARVVIDDTDERVIVTTDIIDVDWTRMSVGMRVEVVFDDVTPELTLPRFRPIASASPPAPAVA